MKINELINTKRVIDAFSHEKIPSKLSYKFAKFISKIDVEERFFQEKMQEIVNLYGVKDESGQFVIEGDGIKIIENQRTECQKAITELNDIDIEKPDIAFTLDELEPLSLSINDMLALSEFITEE